MQLPLNDADKALIRAMRDAHVLEDVDGHRLDPAGVIPVTCADGHRFRDIFDHIEQILSVHGNSAERCVHPLTRHGGPMRLVPKCPANKPGRSTAIDYQDEVLEACEIKNINTIALVNHALCGKACQCGISVVRSMTLMFEGKQLLKKRSQKITVACFQHVDWGDSKRTYFIRRERFLRWQVAGAQVLERLSGPPSQIAATL